jgi:hypothetical protein
MRNGGWYVGNLLLSGIPHILTRKIANGIASREVSIQHMEVMFMPCVYYVCQNLFETFPCCPQRMTVVRVRIHLKGKYIKFLK